MEPEEVEGPTEEEARAALRQLTRLVRAHAQVLRSLQLRPGADDRSILKGLGKFQNLFEVLRTAGCSIPESSKAEEWYLLALQVPQRPRAKRSKKWLLWATAGVVLAVLLICLLIIVIQLTQATGGYQVGSCIINLFTNSSCIQQEKGCSVEVAVRSGDLFLVKSSWSLPVEHTGPDADFTRYSGEPFRCCNDADGHVATCCDLVSGGIEMRTAETFCDSWGSLGKVDWTGQACNTAAWPCLFSVDALEENIVELLLFVRPDVSSYVVVVISCGGILALLVLVPLLVKHCRCDCDFQVAKEEDTGELYDPDDPNSDWGAAVQEALQDEYRRNQELGSLCRKLQELTPRLKELLQLVRSCRCRRRPAERPRTSRSSRSSRSEGTEKDRSSVLRSSVQGERLRASQVAEVPGPEKLEKAPQPPETMASLPPGFIWHGDEEPDIMVKKYQTWEAMEKEVNQFQEKDIHPQFQLGNLAGFARLAEHQRLNLCRPIVEPVAKAKTSASGNQHYSLSTFREGRKRRKKRRPADVKKLQDPELGAFRKQVDHFSTPGMLE